MHACVRVCMRAERMLARARVWPQGQPIEPVCDAAGVRAFPTWIIGGKTIEGELELEQVEAELQKLEAAASKAQ